MSTIKELGLYKTAVLEALFNDPNIKDLVIGPLKGKSAKTIRSEFKDHVKNHLYIDETMSTTGSFIYYDVFIPKLHPHIKNTALKLFCICHRDILDTYDSELDKDGEPVYPGNRADALAQMIENCLVNNDETAYRFGIGPLNLTSVNLYSGQHYYGFVLDFADIHDFR